MAINWKIFFVLFQLIRLRNRFIEKFQLKKNAAYTFNVSDFLEDK